jgi:hypothetical protein
MTRPELSRRIERAEQDLTAISDTMLDIKDTVDQHTEELVGIKRVQEQHTEELVGIKRVQEQHTQMLNQHTHLLNEILRRLDVR